MFIADVTSAGFSWETSVGCSSHRQLLKAVGFVGEERAQIATRVGVRVEDLVD